jgi:phosphopantothenoylcysteine decarboxylase/phosphopantothenate--cysteine ligase
MKILITSGGTKIPIDRVRSITNMSKGTFGSKIADAFYTKLFNDQVMNRDFSHKITFFMAKDSKKPMRQSIDNECFDSGVDIMKYVEYSTFDEYKAGIEKLLTEETYDIIVVAAAVSDYGVANYYNGKYRSREDDMCIKLVKLPKILPIMRKLAPNSVICGFKLLVDSTEDELVEAMRKQITESDVDLVIGNDLRDIKADNHSLLVLSKHDSNVRKYVQPPKDKRDKCNLLYPLAQNVVDECFKEFECNR